MKITQTLRLILGSALLLVAVAVLWWIIGYSLGKTVLHETGGAGSFQRAFGFRESGVIRLFALALLAGLTRLVGGEPGGARWLRIAALAGVAALIFGEKAVGSDLGVVLFVLAAVAASEAEQVQALLVALVAGAIVAFAYVYETNLGTGEKLLVIALRDVFVFTPLLIGHEWIERWLWGRTKESRGTRVAAGA